MRQWAQTETQKIPSEHRNTFSLWGWPSTGTDCPERLRSLHSWRYPKAGHGPGQLARLGPAWAREVGQGDLQISLPTSAILLVLWNHLIMSPPAKHSPSAPLKNTLPCHVSSCNNVISETEKIHINLETPFIWKNFHRFSRSTVQIVCTIWNSCSCFWFWNTWSALSSTSCWENLTIVHKVHLC